MSNEHAHEIGIAFVFCLITVVGLVVAAAITRDGTYLGVLPLPIFGAVGLIFLNDEL